MTGDKGGVGTEKKQEKRAGKQKLRTKCVERNSAKKGRKTGDGQKGALTKSRTGPKTERQWLV